MSGSWCWCLGVYGGGRVIVAGLGIIGCFWLEHLVGTDATWQTHVPIFFVSMMLLTDRHYGQKTWENTEGKLGRPLPYSK